MGRAAVAADAVLLVLPSDAEPELARVPVAGLPGVHRIVLAAARAGFGTILVSPAAGDAPLPAGTAARALADEEQPPASGPRRVVIVATDVVPQREWLQGLLEMPLEPERLYADGESIAVLDVKDPQPVLAAAAGRGAASVVQALRSRFDAEDGRLPRDGRRHLRTAREIPAVEAWLLRGLIKPSEGFMSRHVERRISLAVTRLLARTSVTPNTMTLVSLALGLGAAPFFLASTPASQLAGASLFLAHSILDGCDGELARLKFQESAGGAALDFWGDNVVHAAVFTCMAIGWSLAAGTAWPLLLGAVTIASAAATAAAAARRFMDASAAPVASRTSAVSRFVEALSHRDFIYVILALAAAGKAAWFLLPAAVGTPLFLCLLLWTDRVRR